jgi:hypothetical protein
MQMDKASYGQSTVKRNQLYHQLKYKLQIFNPTLRNPVPTGPPVSCGLNNKYYTFKYHIL